MGIGVTGRSLPILVDFLRFVYYQRHSDISTIHQGANVATQYTAPPPMVIDIDKKITATMRTSSGTIVLDLFPSEAPKTVNNFVFLSREGFYDGVIFHRIIDVGRLQRFRINRFRVVRGLDSIHVAVKKVA